MLSLSLFVPDICFLYRDINCNRNNQGCKKISTLLNITDIVSMFLLKHYLIETMLHLTDIITMYNDDC